MLLGIVLKPESNWKMFCDISQDVVLCNNNNENLYFLSTITIGKLDNMKKNIRKLGKEKSYVFKA